MAWPMKSRKGDLMDRLPSYWTNPNNFRVYCNPVEFRFSPGIWTGTLTATGPPTACKDDPINLKEN
ncbi:unnamed protein product [Malus baccata var. baccata]